MKTISMIIWLMFTMFLAGCGWQNVARSYSGAERIKSIEGTYRSFIVDELAGKTPPNITISWNTHWTSVLKTLRSENQEGYAFLADYIVTERRKNGLPELRFN